MKVLIKGKGREVDLSNSDFLAAGGEGKIYVKGATVFKICDAGKMIPEGKLSELSVLTDTHIIKPDDVLVDGRGKPIGYTMHYVKDTHTLCQLFTKAFRLRNNIKHETVLDLVKQMQKTISHIHDHNILIVDLNEFNFLLDNTFSDVYFIDVNSYQTKSYPATAIMDSIRDRHNKRFDKLSDWFSFAVISFQMFIGIHPYKGRHSVYKDLDERMLNNISVLNKEVGFPAAACQPFSVIPDAYMQWYKSVLEEGKRLPPPDRLAIVHVVVPVVKLVSGGKNLSIDKIREFDSNLIGYYHSSGREVFVTTQKVYVDHNDLPKPSEKVWIGFTKTNLPVMAWLENKMVKLYDLSANKEIFFGLAGEKIMDFDGRLYVQNGMNIIEVIFIDIKHKIIASPHVVANVLEQSTKFYSGVVIQNLFDAYYVSIFPESKQCQQIALRELDGYKIVDARYEGKILMVVAVDKKGYYNRFTFSFKDWKNYELSEKKNITYMGLNFTVLDNGVCLHIDEDENIEIFHRDKLQSVKVVKDDAIHNDMLYHKGANAIFTKDNSIYSMTMRKP